MQAGGQASMKACMHTERRARAFSVCSRRGVDWPCVLQMNVIYYNSICTYVLIALYVHVDMHYLIIMQIYMYGCRSRCAICLTRPVCFRSHDIYIYIYIYIHTHIYINIYTYYMYIYIYIHIYRNMYTYTMYIYIYIYIHMCLYTSTAPKGLASP